ncbi:MAG TPA: protein kinase [Gemmatimonadaceae bacterium]
MPIAPTQAPAAPIKIGKYQIVEPVGEGAMGVVYRATDSMLGRTVAVKVMNASIARDQGLRQRFLREAQAAASLQHPNVVTIYDLGELDGHLFIAMEFVYGADLERLMELKEPLTLQGKLDIICDVLTGLSYAHKKGIVHRDIKPANIRVGDDGRSKIMDFGVAHLMSSNLTRTGLVLGTPSYMAPEQVMSGEITSCTDLYAVGTVLYQLLTGSKPFTSPTLQGLFYKIVTEPPRPVTDIISTIPPELDRITRKALAKDPAARYTDALVMANEISAVRAGLSGATSPSSISLSTAIEIATSEHPVEGRTPTRRIAPYAIGGGIAAAVLLAAWLALGREKDSTPQLPNPPAATAESRPAPAATVPPAPAVASSAIDTSTQQAVATPKPVPAPPTARKTPKQSPTRTPPRTVVTPRKPAQTQAPVVRAAAPTVQSATPLSTGQPQVSNPIVIPTRPAPPPSVPEPAPAKPATPSTADVANIVESYARAIESRDIGAVRRAYPGLTGEQERGFREFFELARNINVTFRIVGLEANGNTADARLVGTYQYVTGSKTERQPVSFAATLRHDGSNWRLISVR